MNQTLNKEKIKLFSMSWSSRLGRRPVRWLGLSFGLALLMVFSLVGWNRLALAAGSADLGIQINPSGSFIAGATITYQVVVTNVGPADVSGLTVLTSLPGGLSNILWTCSATPGSSCPSNGTGTLNNQALNLLGNNGSATFTLQATLVSSATGSITAQAFVFAPAGTIDPNVTNDYATVTTPITYQADLAATKTHQAGLIQPGGALSYLVVVTNLGPSDMSGAVLVDNFPATLSGISWTCSATTGASCGAATSGNGSLNSTLGLLPQGGSVSFTVQTTVAGNAIGQIVNTANVTSPTLVPDPQPANNQVSDTTYLGPVADVALTQQVNFSNRLVGETAIFTISLINNGPVQANGVLVTNLLPSGLTYQTAQTTQGNYDPATGVWTVGSLSVGQTVNLKLVVLAQQAGVWQNTTTKTAQQEPDPNPSNDSASQSVTVTSPPAPALPPVPAPPAPVAKPKPSSVPADVVAQLRLNPDRQAAFSPETLLSYTLIIRNIGPGSATGVYLRFPLDNRLNVGYALFSDSRMWVSAIVTDVLPGYLQISLPDLPPNSSSLTATLVMRPGSLASADLTLLSRYHVWYTDEVAGKETASNGVRLNFGPENRNETDSAVQFFTPRNIQVQADSLASGEALTVSADFYAPGEIVNFWYTLPDGTSSALGSVQADEAGQVSYAVKGLTVQAGESYSLSGYGNRSGVTGQTVIQVS